MSSTPRRRLAALGATAAILLAACSGTASPSPSSSASASASESAAPSSGEKVRIGNDRHVYINDRRLDVQDPGFDRVYSFDPNKPPETDHYSGHVNATVWQH